MADSLNYSLGKKWLTHLMPDIAGSDGIFFDPIKGLKNNVGKKWLMLIVDNGPL